MLRGAAQALGLGRVKRALLGRSQQPRIAVPKRAHTGPKRYLSIATIFKNESPYLAEWLEFHRLVGVEHVYLYDNGSTDKPETVLAPFLQQRFVTVIPWAFPWAVGSVTAQVLAYAHALTNFGLDWRWMGFIDIDEFLFPLAEESLPILLKDYEDLPAIAAFWTMFGFSGHDTPPRGLVIENYTMRARYPSHAKPKSIVDPAKVVAVSNPHLFDLTTGLRQAFSDTRQLYHKQERRTGMTVVGSSESTRLRLHHYYTRSRQEFEAKGIKGRESGRPGARKLDALAEMIEADTVNDGTILRFVPALKARLATSEWAPA